MSSFNQHISNITIMWFSDKSGFKTEIFDNKQDANARVTVVNLGVIEEKSLCRGTLYFHPPGHKNEEERKKLTYTYSLGFSATDFPFKPQRICHN